MLSVADVDLGECSLGKGQGIGRLIQEKTQELGEKPVPVQFFPPQITHELPWG